MPAFQFSPLFLAAQVISVAIMILFPLVLAIIVRRRLHLSWRYIGYGALVFVVAQMFLRIPLVTVAQMFLAPVLSNSANLQILFALALAFTAALFETGGRYLGYRVFMRNEEKTWAKGVLYGIGHGGIESMVLVGLVAIGQLVAMTSITNEQLVALDPAVATALRNAAASWQSLPLWLSFGGAIERICTIAFHVAMSVLVLQIFIRGQRRWFWYALAAHTALDFILPFVLPRILPDPITISLVIQVLEILIGLAALWLIRALRPLPDK